MKQVNPREQSEIGISVLGWAGRNIRTGAGGRAVIINRN